MMLLNRIRTFVTVGFGVFGFTVSASAQDVVEQPIAPPPVVVEQPVAPPTVVVQNETTVVDKPVDRDRVRFRGGLGIGGGILLGNQVDFGGNFALGIRLGVQITRVFGLYYQNSPTLILFKPPHESSGIVGALDLNSILVAFDLVDHLELAVGPSVDYGAVLGCDRNSLSCTSDTGTAFGIHGRAALLLGSRDKDGGRRNGLALGIDAHPIFVVGGDPIFILGANIGIELY